MKRNLAQMQAILYRPARNVRRTGLSFPKRMLMAKMRYARSRVPRALQGRYSSHRREIKYVDIAYNAITIRAANIPPTGQVLNIPVQGAAPYNRIGSKVMNKSIRVRGHVQQVATALPTIVRIIIIYDRQTNGATPSWATVIQSTTSNGTQGNAALDGINMDNRERFKMLADEQILLPAATFNAGVVTNASFPDTSGPTNKLNFDRYIKLFDLETHYKASAGAVGDIATGGIFLFAVMDGDDSSWEFLYTARLRYDDL